MKEKILVLIEEVIIAGIGRLSSLDGCVPISERRALDGDFMSRKRETGKRRNYSDYEIPDAVVSPSTLEGVSTRQTLFVIRRHELWNSVTTHRHPNLFCHQLS